MRLPAAGLRVTIDFRVLSFVMIMTVVWCWEERPTKRGVDRALQSPDLRLPFRSRTPPPVLPSPPSSLHGDMASCKIASMFTYEGRCTRRQYRDVNMEVICATKIKNEF